MHVYFCPANCGIFCAHSLCMCLCACITYSTVCVSHGAVSICAVVGQKTVCSILENVKPTKNINHNSDTDPTQGFPKLYSVPSLFLHKTAEPTDYFEFTRAKVSLFIGLFQQRSFETLTIIKH